MTRAELVEAARIGIATANGCVAQGVADDCRDGGDCLCNRQATAALAAIEAAGMAVVPREATPAMLADGHACAAMPWASVVPPEQSEPDYVLAMMWRAMIAASPVEARDE